MLKFEGFIVRLYLNINMECIEMTAVCGLRKCITKKVERKRTTLSIYRCPSTLHNNNTINTFTVHTLTHNFSPSLPPLPLSCTRALLKLVGAHCLSPLIDYLPGITFQTINTIKNPLKPLKPQRTSDHLTIKTHRKKTASPVRAHRRSLLETPRFCYDFKTYFNMNFVLDSVYDVLYCISFIWYYLELKHLFNRKWTFKNYNLTL